MAAQMFLLPLLEEDALETALQIGGQDHVAKPSVGIRSAKNTCELALRLGERKRPSAPRDRSAFVLRSVDEFPQLLGQFSMSLASLMRSKLHCGGEEALLIPGDVGF